MKKSTLITTIAMIVVVVVALSTATYAWFASATNSVATAANIQTISDADWTLTKGAPTAVTVAATPGTGTTATFAAGASSAITLNNTMASGLYAPSAEIATAATGEATSAISGLATFYNAQKVDSDVKQLTAFDNTVAGKEYKLPDVIKVTNAKQADQVLVCSVIIKVGNDMSSTTKLYAGAATSFYAQATTVGGSAIGSWTNGYKYKAKTTDNTNFADQTTTTVNGSQYGIMTTVAAAGAATASTASTATKPIYEDAAASTIVNEATVYTNWQQSAGDESLGLADGDYYLQYSFKIGTVAATKSVYVTIYTWIDGWVADENAAGAKYDVLYAFTKYTA